MPNSIRLLVALLLSALFLAGCGQKGPLYLPGDTNTIRTTVQRQPAQTEDEEEDEQNTPTIMQD